MCQEWIKNLGPALREMEQYTPENYSLLNGKAGLLYFFAKYRYHSQTGRYREKTEQLSSELISLINDNQNSTKDTSFLTGITGVCSVLHQLHSQGLLTTDTPNTKHADEFLYTSAIQHARSPEFNFAEGVAGIISYFCKRNPENIIVQYLDGFTRNAPEWAAAAHQGVIDYSLWKGLCGKISLLMRLLHHFPGNNRLLNLLETNLQTLRESVLQIDAGLNHFSFIPVSAETGSGLVNAPNLLTWQFGDLPAALVFYRAAQLTGKKEYDNLASLMGSYSLSRTSQNQTGIHHAGFTSGSSGTALMYRLLEQESGRAFYRKGCLYWLKQTEEWLNTGTALAGSELPLVCISRLLCSPIQNGNEADMFVP